MNAAAFATLPADKMRMGSGLINIMQQGLGGTMSIAMLTTLLRHRAASYVTLLDQQQTLSHLGMGEILDPVRAMVMQAGTVGATADMQALAALRLHLEQQATVAAYQDCFLLMGILGMLIIPLVVLLRR